ncbi:MAG TPA: hypothetical protein VHP12_03365, partial [Chitinophagaceae bacterium]|nr:hypothetical protein [Chitinophagaceae bacterium]
TNNILVNRYQPYAGGQGPIQLNNGSDLNWSFRVGTSDLFEDIKFIGGFRFGTNISDKDVFLSFQNYRRRLDWGFTYYRSNIKTYNGFFLTPPASYYNSSIVTNLYQFNFSYPLNEVKSFRITIGARNDRGTIRPFNNSTGAPDPYGLAYHDSSATYGVGRFEFVHDNSLNPAQNIWVGSRYKIYLDVNVPINNAGFTTYNLGYDARQYIKIYRNFIWAGRAAADFSWGKQKIIYYLGGVDGWINPQFNNLQPAPDQTYAFQSLAINMRGYNQNAANGNNAVVFNSEFRLPVFTTFFDRPINNAFLRNFQLTQFFDLGTAWNGKFNGIQRPTVYYGQQNQNNPIIVQFDSGGIGPFAAGYGFGARSTLLGYFLKLDTGWPMLGFFKGKPIWYFSLGLDF